MMLFPSFIHTPPNNRKITLPAEKQLNPSDVSIIEKWKALKLDPSWIEESFDDVRFLVKTRLIYNIIGFQQSTSKGKKEDVFVRASSIDKQFKGICIKKGGNLTPISEIRKTLKWNEKEHVLISKKNPLEKWSYISGEGLLPYHGMYEQHLLDRPDYPRHHAKLRPVAKLSQTEMNRLLTHANSLSRSVSKAPSAECALQFITHPAAYFAAYFDQPYLQNLNAQLNVHCGIRLIMPDGSVYSFGFGADQYEHRFKKEWHHAFTTVNGQMKNFDYLEFQKFDSRLVTTVPLDAKTAENMLRTVNIYREHGIRFNLLKQNCMRMAAHLLAMAGIHVDIRISLISMCLKALPNAEQIPFVGSSLKKVKKCTFAIQGSAAAKIPDAAKLVFAELAKVTFFIPQKLAEILLYISLYACGAARASPNSSLPLEKTTRSDQLENFECLAEKLFDPDLGYVYHSSSFIAWQLEQATTEAYRYSGRPALNILPPESDNARRFSEERKSELKKRYQAF